MIKVPVCRWRRERTIAGHHRCRSPKLVHGANGVKDELCLTCHLCDHQRPTPLELVHLWCTRLGFRLPAIRVRAAQLNRFAIALARHAAAGFPRANAKDVVYRDSKCSPCFWRDREKDACSKCGCNLGGVSYLPNKKYMALEQCPLWNPEKPEHFWGPVRGETVWARAWIRVKKIIT